MSSRRKVVAISSIRSEYNLLSTLFKKLHADADFEFSMLVSGAHVSPGQGHSIDEIIADGLPVFARIESLLSADTRGSRLKSAGILLVSCIDQLATYRPDLIIYAGDREDVLIGGMLGAFLDIPTVHFFGGDHASDGIVDNSIRHAASKLSSLHFVSTEEHARRLVCLGESPSRVFAVGSPAIDRFRLAPVIDRVTLLNKYAVPQWDRFAVVIFHPVLGDEENGGRYFAHILQSLRQVGVPAFVSYPNIDSGNRRIVEVIEALQGDPGFVLYRNLPDAEFVNLMRQADVLVGNSSCGLVEAPYLQLGAVNVGMRQTGRADAGNVIFSGTSQEEITAALTRALSAQFQQELLRVPSPFGDGHASERAFSKLKSLDWGSFVRKPEDPLARSS